jgi:hypothetical protein
MDNTSARACLCPPRTRAAAAAPRTPNGSHEIFIPGHGQGGPETNTIGASFNIDTISAFSTG